MRKPVEAVLEIRDEREKLGNAWNLWFFPKLAPKAGAGVGLCASPTVHEILADRYPGMTGLGTPAAAEAKTLLTAALDAAACQWLRQGKKRAAVEDWPGPLPA